MARRPVGSTPAPLVGRRGTERPSCDRDKRQVAAITEHDRERGGTTTHSWLLLDRNPQLAEPERSLVMASPLLLNCFLYSLGMDRQFS